MLDESPEKIEIHGTSGDFAFVAALNVLIDVMVTRDPPLGAQLRIGLLRKQAELKADPATEQAARALSVVINALVLSPRALQRTPPEGQA